MAMSTKGWMADLSRRIRELHPDEMAEITVVPIVAGNSVYFDWLMTQSWLAGVRVGRLAGAVRGTNELRARMGTESLSLV